ncbi:hypothetical protein QFC21_004844 [Naganishia friedmannii]|uniref:Uncharacterized protein n=1 Tax=Naganishia friedmannii TaxID=89922 RepID=A0ACC2VDK9_9TREE|nr:hypothetical protein QFC21_004844 [Naganishia friedmannii]
MATVFRQPAGRVVAATARRLQVPATAKRYNATLTSQSSTPTPGQGLFMSGPAAPKVQSEAKVVKYAGKKKPITPGVRHTIQVHHPHLHKDGPLRDLTLPLRRSGGRNSTGRVVNRFVGGGHKRRLRIVDFSRKAEGEHEVVRIEYDPGRTAHIALIRSRQTSSSTTPAKQQALPLELDISSWGPQPFATLATTTQHKELEKVCGGYSYILAPDGLRAGDVVRSYRSGIPEDMLAGLGSGGYEDAVSTPSPEDTDPASPQTVLSPTSSAGSASSSRALGLLRTLTLKPGNVLPLDLCPPGTIIHGISLKPEGKMQLCRSAGTFGQIVAHGIGKRAVGEGELSEGNVLARQGWTLVKLQSGEVRKLHPKCIGTVGVVSNKEHQQEQIGKAGRARWMGIRPRVRGVAMNACDHPHGGGRGKSKGNKHPRSVWGWLTKGKRTRRPKDKDGNKMVVTERPRGKASKN